MKTMKTTASRILKYAGCTAGLIALAFLAAGCGPSSSQAGETSMHSCHVYAGLDTSASWRKSLGVSATLCARQALRLDPDRDTLTLYRLDSSTREFSDGPAPESGDQLQRVIVHELGSVSTTRGTFPARFWTAVAARAVSNQASVIVEIFSDGDNDDETAASAMAMKAAAQRLARNPHVSGVWIFGAEPRNWTVLRGEFAPLGDRFHLCSPLEMTMDRIDGAVTGGQ